MFITGPFFGAHGFNNSDSKKFPSFGGVISKVHFAPKTPKIEICFLRTHGFDNPDLRKFLGFGVVISRLHFCPKTSKIEMCSLRVLFLGPMVLMILIRRNSQVLVV